MQPMDQPIPPPAAMLCTALRLLLQCVQGMLLGEFDVAARTQLAVGCFQYA